MDEAIVLEQLGATDPSLVTRAVDEIERLSNGATTFLVQIVARDTVVIRRSKRTSLIVTAVSGALIIGVFLFWPIAVLGMIVFAILFGIPIVIFGVIAYQFGINRSVIRRLTVAIKLLSSYKDTASLEALLDASACGDAEVMMTATTAIGVLVPEVSRLQWESLAESKRTQLCELLVSDNRDLVENLLSLLGRTKDPIAISALQKLVSARERSRFLERHVAIAEALLSDLSHES